MGFVRHSRKVHDRLEDVKEKKREMANDIYKSLEETLKEKQEEEGGTYPPEVMEYIKDRIEKSEKKKK